jgi:hypothetical protein
LALKHFLLEATLDRGGSNISGILEMGGNEQRDTIVMKTVALALRDLKQIRLCRKRSGQGLGSEGSLRMQFENGLEKLERKVGTSAQQSSSLPLLSSISS